jgi:Xaa-Pro aminopeptidase
VLLAALAKRPRPKRLGVEFSSCTPQLTAALAAELVDVEPKLYEMRRRKDPDELARLRKAIAGTAAMHRRAREIIAPGINELEVFNQLQAAAVAEYGEMMTGTGNDYASGERGGPPRDRKIVAGELYILDLGPAFRGYFADNTRVTAVGGKPTDEQLEAHKHILEVFKIVERTVKPGKRCRELFDECYAWLNRPKRWEFEHHLGHGIGLFPHEAPHLNPKWDDTFQAGEVFAVEPGLYSDSLRAGIRLENNYLVTESGVELLTPFPMEM